eukprot:snap_masked-scaffold_1-processed-gene-8.34-mRNA-1 protein AED:1.00 eAED:1.00 QI:0/0/0/0/1/1/2/0/73
MNLGLKFLHSCLTGFAPPSCGNLLRTVDVEFVSSDRCVFRTDSSPFLMLALKLPRGLSDGIDLHVDGVGLHQV